MAYRNHAQRTDMDKAHSRKATPPLPAHHQRTPELPRHWITLPLPARRAAQQHPLLEALFPSHVGFFPQARRHQVVRRSIDTHIVQYCVKGRGFCELAGQRFDVGPGDVMVVPRGVEHSYGSDAFAPWTIYWFHAMGRHMPALLAELGASPARPIVHVGAQRELVALFSELRRALEDDYSEPRLLYASRVLTYLMGRLISLRQAASREVKGSASRVQSTLEHIHARYAEPIAVETLAAMAGLSTSQYGLRFRALTGTSPKAYVNRLRIHRATQLLDTTDESVAAIARRVGYDDPLYFSRAFRRLHDTGPSQYRKGRG